MMSRKYHDLWKRRLEIEKIIYQRGNHLSEEDIKKLKEEQEAIKQKQADMKRKGEWHEI